MAKRMFITGTALLMVLSGCAASRIVDEISLIQAASFDKGEEKKYLGGLMMPIYKDPETTESFVMSAEGDAVREVRIELNGRSPKPLVPGQLRVTLLGEELANEGVIEIVDVMYRDPTIGMRPFLAVAKGRAYSLLEQESKVTHHSAMYIADLINQNMEDEYLPRTNLHVFLNSYYNDGKDPFLPYLSEKGGNVELEGIAILRGDKMVGKLGREKTFLLKLLSKEGYRDGGYILTFGEDEQETAVIENVSTNTEYEMKKPDHFVINVSFKGILKEYSSGDKNKSADRKKIQAALQKEMESKGNALVAELQELKADTLGIGEFYRSITRDWQPEKWKRTYPDVTITVKVIPEILETGVSE
ncbi:Ger(x)C family spore germination protein [Bacillus marinisedimentorum]|uniref:Ger(x)C family spore germination protein n=1 Tax=Bacillus marinisedimentorum TaxID=1821260 RepID=UPI0007E0F795|nr:Ger(x)C family spore germination protein [Bacillus marinisedimentorum]